MFLDVLQQETYLIISPDSFFASKGDIIHRNNTGEIIKYVSRCTTTSFQPCNDAAQDYDAFQVYLTHMSNANTFVGLCGSPVMINGSSPLLVVYTLRE